VMWLVWGFGTTLMQETAVEKTIELSLGMQFFVKEGWAYLCVIMNIPSRIMHNIRYLQRKE